MLTTGGHEDPTAVPARVNKDYRYMLTTGGHEDPTAVPARVNKITC
jgi:hypothetical protein